LSRRRNDHCRLRSPDRSNRDPPSSRSHYQQHQALSAAAWHYAGGLDQVTPAIMKRHVSVIVLVLISLAHAHAQQVMSIMDARAAGMTRDVMDSLYMSAFNRQDTTLEAFPGQTEEFMAQWDSTLTLLKTYLVTNGLRFDPEQRMTYRS